MSKKQHRLTFYSVRSLRYGSTVVWSKDEFSNLIKNHTRGTYKSKTFKDPVNALNFAVEGMPEEEIQALELDFKQRVCNSLPRDGKLHVWTDGSTLNNGTAKARGGIGVWWGPMHPDNLSEPYIDGNVTNNRCEIQAAISALQTINSKLDIPLSFPLVIHSDSQQVVSALKDWIPRLWLPDWKKSGGEIKNVDLYQKLWELWTSRTNVEVVWTKGHSGADDMGNVFVDILATRAAASMEEPTIKVRPMETSAAGHP